MLTLPLPPSTNKLFANVPGKGRIRTKAYKQWRHDAGWELKAQRPTPVAGNVAVAIHVPQSMRGDVDNRLKALLDLLVAHHVIEDDRLVSKLIVERQAHLMNQAMIEVRAVT